MTDPGPVRPRRALGPLPSDDEGGPQLPAGSRALPFDPDWTPADTDTQVLRRVMPGPSPDDTSAASPASPTEPASRTWAPTPVPPPRPVPPRPVLPETTASLQASAGRRFSASAEPTEFAPAAPRRSATSVSSPPMVDFDPPAAPTVVTRPAPPTAITRPSTAPAATSRPSTATIRPSTAPAPTAPESAAGSGDADATDPPRRRTGRRAAGVLAAVLVMAGGVGGSVWWLGTQPTTPTSSPPPTSTPSPSLDPLLTPADLGRLGGTAWLVDSTPATPPGGNPICLPPGVERMPVADRTAPRTLTAAAPATGVVSHVVETYADPAAARQAYTARLQQAGRCAETDALIVSTATVAGLADAAFASHIEVQIETPEHHTVVVSQTGRNLSMIDVVSTEPIDPAEVAKVAAKPLARLCSGGEGTCPTTVALQPAIPAAGEFPGWLVEADLPRITAGAGRWGATEPTPELTITGSQCEALSLIKVPGVTSSAQRTMLLADDPSAPTGFGIDQVVYTFPDWKPSRSFADKVGDNLADCEDRVPTATVKKGPTVKGEGAGGVTFSGKSFLITQKTGESDSVPFRVAVLRISERVTYLMANPSSGFDFTADQWKAIMIRAAERVSQLP